MAAQKTASKKATKATKAQIVAAAAKRHKVPPWLLWGVFGAESTYGTNGTNYFGLIEPEYNGRKVGSTTNIAEDADIAAELLAHLKQEHGSWGGAVLAYSGGEYNINHPRELSRGGQEQGKELVDIETPLGNIPLPGPNLEFNNPLGPLNGLATEGLEHVPGLGGVGEALGSISEVGKFLGELSKLIFTPEGWLQIGQVAGGIILIGWGLHHIINVSTGVNVTRTATRTAAKTAEVAAVVK